MRNRHEEIQNLAEVCSRAVEERDIILLGCMDAGRHQPGFCGVRLRG